MQKWNGSLLRKFDDAIDGNASVGTTIVVRNTVGNTLAVIYDVDDTNSVQKNNPFVTDDFGRYSFFAPNGKYTIEFGDGSDDIEITLVDNIDISSYNHNELGGRNPADGTAHNAADILNSEGGTLQDIISRVVSGDTGRAYRVQFGVIRNGGTGWFIINDAVHEPCGIQSVSVDPDGTIRVTHNVGAVEVGTLIAAVDETFAKKGFIVGSSVGTSISFITITAPLNFTVNTAAVTGTLAVPSTAGLTVPAHFGSDIKAYKVGGVVTINHPSVDTNDVPVGTTAGSARKTDFNLAFGTTQTVIQGVGNVDGYIRYDGASWLVTTTLTVPPTMVWDGGSSTLTVTHPDCDIYNISVVPRDDGHVVSVGSIGNTTFTIKFYDKVTGALITSLGTLMKFYVSRKAKALKTDVSGSVNIRRGYAQADAAKVISTTGNIWLSGLGNL